jgi:hypothetical protein
VREFPLCAELEGNEGSGHHAWCVSFLSPLVVGVGPGRPFPHRNGRLTAGRPRHWTWRKPAQTRRMASHSIGGPDRPCAALAEKGRGNNRDEVGDLHTQGMGQGQPPRCGGAQGSSTLGGGLQLYRGSIDSIVPSQWSDWTFWQFSETGTVPGINSKVDMDRFNGASADLRMLSKDAASGMVTT